MSRMVSRASSYNFSFLPTPKACQPPQPCKDKGQEVVLGAWILISEKGRMMKRLPWFGATVLVVAAAGAIAHAQQKTAAKSTPSAGVTRAVCALHALGDSKVTGTVTFTQGDGYVDIVANVAGLTPGKHGFHIHEFGDCTSADGMSTGGHFNPGEMPHGAHDNEKRHAGDMGNLDADASGKATLKIRDKHMKLNGPQSIVGRAVIVHAKADDFGQPTGNAGGRIACGVIGVGKAT